MTRILLLAAALLVVHPTLAADPAATSAEGSTIRALLITGGCCHDYQNQKKIISEGLSKSVGKIEWTILQYGSGSDIKADIYQHGDWIKGYDIVIHNECFGAVEDGPFVEGIVRAHTESKTPAIVIHCAMHSYRNAPTAETWRSFLGVTSRRHERSKHSLHVVRTDEGKKQAIVDSIGDGWDTPNGELYIIEKVWPSTKVLANVHSEETGHDEPVIWTNELKGTRVFGISLGHHNETMLDETWQAVVAAGFQWAMNHEG
jgi:hypothetical protein